jgi:hypothetical protein
MGSLPELMRRSWLPVCLAVLGFPAAAGAIDTVVAADPTAENVSAWGAALVWSRHDAAGAYRLVAQMDGVASEVPVPPSRHPFDADVGPDRRGRAVAVYTRCSSAGGHRCDLYQTVLGTGRERRLARLSSRDDEFAPSRWGARYVFARSALLAQGRGAARRISGAVPNETDVVGPTVAFSTSFGRQDVDVEVSRIYVKRLGRQGRSCRVAQGDLGDVGGTRLSSPVLAGGYVYWLDDTSDPIVTVRVGRARLHRRECPDDRRFATLPTGASSIAVEGGAVFYTDPIGVRRADGPFR